MATTPTDEVRAFRALDAITEHLQTCPRWWFPTSGRTLHCAEHMALSDAFQQVMAPILQRHRDGVADPLDLEREITRFHQDWGARFTAWSRAQRWRKLARRFRPGPAATHTPTRAPWLAAYDRAPAR